MLFLRVLVTASRTWEDREPIWNGLDLVRDELVSGGLMTVVHGGAAGGDGWAEDWAAANGVNQDVFRPDYAKHGGRRAPMIRNMDMVRTRPGLCLAFIRDRSAGATGCAGAAKAAGIPTVVTTWERRHEPLQLPEGLGQWMA